MTAINKVYLKRQFSDLTSCIIKTTAEIDRTRKLFIECKIILDENDTTEFITALTKLFKQINECEKEDVK